MKLMEKKEPDLKEQTRTREDKMSKRETRFVCFSPSSSLQSCLFFSWILNLPPFFLILSCHWLLVLMRLLREKEREREWRYFWTYFFPFFHPFRHVHLLLQPSFFFSSLVLFCLASFFLTLLLLHPLSSSSSFSPFSAHLIFHLEIFLHILIDKEEKNN